MQHQPLRNRSQIEFGCQGWTRAALAAVLTVLLIDQPLMAASVGPKHGPTAGASQSKGEGRVLHALNRLTFGPRPGDIAAVEAVGLRTWFENQLDPQKIDDSALNTRLAQYPAMQLPQSDLMARYPSQQMIRQMAQREAAETGQGFPRRFGAGRFIASNETILNDPVERAIYNDQMAFYRLQQDAKAAKGNVASTAQTSSISAEPNMGSDMAASAGSEQQMTPSARTDQNEISSGVAKADVMEAGQIPADHVENLYDKTEVAKIVTLSPDERMKKVVAMPPSEFVAFRQSLSGGELFQFAQGLSAQQKEIFAAMQNSTRMVGAEEMQVRLLRDIYTERQLEAVMTDFWLNHFNVYVRKNQNEPYLIPAYERDVIRPNALGKFEDLLVATAKSPAMQMYLDNWQSIGPDSAAAKNGPKLARFAQNPQVKAVLKDRGLNENYGRELMELHTLGVNGGYTQQDVTEVAKVFTGWTITPPNQGAEFQFDERRHEPGTKTVLGQKIKENGMNEGLQVLHMLATSPATAKFISTKLAIRFVSDDPPSSLTDKMSQAFLSSGGDIKTVLRAMFEAPEFWAPAAERAKVKTPLEFVVSSVRASDATVNNAIPLVAALDKLGMPLYGMQTPNGYSWKSDPWVSTGALVSRMNFALVLASDRLPGVNIDWSKLVKGTATADSQVTAKERKLEASLLGFPLSEKTRTQVLAEADDQTVPAQAAKEFEIARGGGATAAFSAIAQRRGIGPTDPQAAVMAGLLLGSPEFQRR
ncbi:MAG TPA: DUF1800 domain-containing protein [Acidobacteriaceae bacterium]|nr:DUF1800 domain-containing protein [Acidobacteriaceae bacterium]